MLRRSASQMGMQVPSLRERFEQVSQEMMSPHSEGVSPLSPEEPAQSVEQPFQSGLESPHDNGLDHESLGDKHTSELQDTGNDPASIQPNEKIKTLNPKINKKKSKTLETKQEDVLPDTKE